MPTANELEELTNNFLDDMIDAKGEDCDGREAEQAQVMGFVGKRSRTDCVSGKDVRKD